MFVLEREFVQAFIISSPQYTEFSKEAEHTGFSNKDREWQGPENKGRVSRHCREGLIYEPTHV